LQASARRDLRGPACVQVIPPSRRSLAYALDSGMSGLIKSCTIPVAGLVIERLGGHAVQKVAAAAGAGGDDAAAPAPAGAPADNRANARALEDGLLYLILISYGVKIFVRPAPSHASRLWGTQAGCVVAVRSDQMPAQTKEVLRKSAGMKAPQVSGQHMPSLTICMSSYHEDLAAAECRLQELGAECAW